MVERVRDIQLIVRLDADEDAEVEELVKQYRVTRSQLVRNLLREEYKRYTRREGRAS